MVKFKSDFSPDTLKERWDDFTSPARFAGNDDTMDLIFVAKRKNEKLKLVRRARSSFEPFACVFRGKIIKSEQGGEIVGIFTKSIVDYFVVAGIFALLFYIRSFIVERGTSLNTINSLLIIAIVSAVLLLKNRRASKRKYSEFIYRVTGQDMQLFKTKREENEDE